jgi:hypothetical protein
VVTPIGVGQATGAAVALGAATAAAGNGAGAAAPDLVAPATTVHEESDVTALHLDDTLAPGARLGFGDEPKTLAVEGPHSDEFFIPANVPVARASTRVPTEAPPADDAQPEKESRGARRRRLGIPRRITFRVILFVLLIAAVPVAAYFVIRWYAYDNWTVTLQGDQVVIMQGQHGGVLWFHPRLAERTACTTTDIPPQSVDAVRAGIQEPSLSAAHDYIDGLTAPTVCLTTATTTTTGKATTTTTGKATTTTSKPPGTGTSAP